MLIFSPLTLSFNLIMFSTLFHVTNATPCDYRYQLFYKFYCRYYLSSTRFISDHNDTKEAKQPMLPNSSILSIFYYYPCFIELSNIGFYFLNISTVNDVTHAVCL